MARFRTLRRGTLAGLARARAACGLVLVLLMAPLTASCAPEAPEAQAGQLDLRGFDLQRAGPVALRGRYRVAWNALLTPDLPAGQLAGAMPLLLPVPGQWLNLAGLPAARPGHGAATYRLEVLLGRPAAGLAIRLPQPAVALRVWLNGVWRSERGRPALSPRDEVAGFGADVVAVPDGATRLSLVLQLSNHLTRTGGFGAAPLLGPRDAVLQETMGAHVGTALTFAALLIIALYHLGISWLARGGEAQRLLAFNALAVAIHQALASGGALTPLLPAQVPRLLLLRVEYLVLYLSMPLGLLLVARLFPNETRARWFGLLGLLGAAFTLLPLLLPVELYTRTLAGFALCAVLGLMAVGYTLCLAVRRGRAQARPLLLAFVVYMLASLHDLLVAHGHVPRLLGEPRAPSLLLFLGVEAWALAKRFADGTRRELSLSHALSAQNRALEQTNRSIERFVPGEILALLGKGSLRDVRRGDHVALTMEVLFCDIRGFTRLVEATSPGEAFGFINDYLEALEPAVHAHGGFINQYLGDCIMALYPSGADAAVRSALAMLERLATFNQQRAAEQAPIRVGIGVSSGPVILGAIGGSERLDSGVVGDAVNLAARIEHMTIEYGAALLLGEDTVARLTHPEAFSLRKLDRVLPKGKTRPVHIFEVLAALPEAQREARLSTRSLFEAGVAAYQRGDLDEARRTFERTSSLDPLDRASALYRARCG